MNKLCNVCSTLKPILLPMMLLIAGNRVAAGQASTTTRTPAAEQSKPLVLTETIPLPGVKGRFDHFASGGGRLFISELGNNSIAVINTGGRTLDRTVTGVPDPQGEAFSPEANKIFSASRAGKLYIYDGKTYDLITTVDFPGGADNLRYDAAARRVYMACGDEKTGAIATADAMTNQRLDEEYKLGGQPESFQLEKSGPNIYVNLPGLKQIAILNRKTQEITRWPLTIEGNFPTALDEEDHRLFVGTHEPPRMAVFDTTSGHMIAALPAVQDTDDLYYDSVFKRIYMPGGEGFIDVFQMKHPDHYSRIAKVPTAIGGARPGISGWQGRASTHFIWQSPLAATNPPRSVSTRHNSEDAGPTGKL